MRTLDTLMLLEGGHIVNRSFKNRWSKENQVKPTVYDKNYVINKVVNDVLEPLRHLPYDKLLKLIQEAYEYAQYLETKEPIKGADDGFNRWYWYNQYLLEKGGITTND